MGGDGGDGGSDSGNAGNASDSGNANDGSVGADGGIGTSGDANDSVSSSAESDANLGDFGTVGTLSDASFSDAAMATAAQTGLATGLDGVSATGFGAFGPTDAPTGANPANTPGFGSFADASLGPGIGYGDIGGFGVTGFGNGISGFGGIGGFGSGAPGAPGGFGNIGVGTANDSIASTATGMGLGINDSTDANTTAAQIASLGNVSGAALGTLGESFGTAAAVAPAVATPAEAAIPAQVAQVAQAALPASPALSLNEQAALNAKATQNDPEAAQDAKDMADATITAGKLGLLGPNAVVTSQQSLPTQTAIGEPTAMMGFTGFGPTGFGPSPSFGPGVSVAANEPSPENEGIAVAPSIPGVIGPTADSLSAQAAQIAAQNVAMNQNEGFNAIDAALNATPTAVATTSGTPGSVSIGGQSTAASVGTGPASSPGVSIAAAPAIGASPGTAAAPSSGQSVSAALANAIGSETGFGAVGDGLNFTNPAGSILLAQYPWLGFQAATS